MAAEQPNRQGDPPSVVTTVQAGPADDLAPRHGDHHRGDRIRHHRRTGRAALGHNGIAVVVALACGSVVATAATVIFNVALVFAATDRIEGRTPTIRGSMVQAWGRRKVIFSWAILSAVVGTAIRLLEQRRARGPPIGFAEGSPWAAATFLVIPVLAFENVGPIEAVKRSSSILKARFGTVARGGLRFGLLFLGFSTRRPARVLVGAVCIAEHVYVVGVPIAVLRVCPAHRRLDVRVSRRDVHANDSLSVRDGSAIPDLGVDVSGTFKTY